MQPFHNDDVVRQQFNGLIGRAGMNGKIIDRGIGCLSGLEAIQMPDQQLVVKSKRMIIINPSAFFKAEVRVVFIIVILRYERHFICSQTVNDGARYRRFAGAGPAGDTNNEHGVIINLPKRLPLQFQYCSTAVH
ncbi:hypothetical protein D3C73_624090 [compost metagenome]